MCSPTGGEYVHAKTYVQVHEQDVICRQRRLCASDEDLVFNSRTEEKETLRKTKIDVDMQTATGVTQCTTEANAYKKGIGTSLHD